MIVDGQHRFVACKYLNVPIKYIVYSHVEGKEIPDTEITELIIMANNTGKPWKVKDYINWYADFDDNVIYKNFREYYDTYKSMDINALYCIITNNPSQRAKEVIESNSLNFVKTEALTSQIEFIDSCSEIFIDRVKGSGGGYRKNVINLALYNLMKSKDIPLEDLKKIVITYANCHRIDGTNIQSCMYGITRIFNHG